jgi:hypothetical protein
MIKKNIKSILFSLIVFTFSACGGGSSDKTTSSSTQTVINTNEESNETQTVIDTNEETILQAALQIDNLDVQVHNNTFATTSKMYTQVGSMLSDYARMNESVTERMNAEMKLLNTLSKAFAIDSAYSSIFGSTSDYTATTPAFVIKQALSKNYFLVSSQSKFYLEGKTVKTLFKDANSLSTAWVRAIQSADITKDLYLSLLELDSNGLTKRVTNSFIVKSETLKSY